MKCPLLHVAWVSGGRERMTGFDDCLKEECAWWDEGSSACAIWALMSGLDALGKVFRELADKMPHKGQFLEK